MNHQLPRSQRAVRSALCAGLLLLLSTSCASTKLVDSWSDPEYRDAPLRDVLIVGMSQDERNRRIFESELASRLDARGVKVVRSSDIEPDLHQLDKSHLKPKFEELGLDRVLVTRTVDVQQESYYTPGSVYTREVGGFTPHRGYYRRFGHYYDRVYETTYSPGHTTTYEIVSMETNLYDTTRDALIWSVISESFDPRSMTETIDKLADLIIADLESVGLVPSQ